MKLGIIELFRHSRVLKDEGLEELANVILNYGPLSRIFDSYKVFDRRPEDIGTTLDRDWIFDYNYNKSYPDKFPNILALLTIKKNEGIDVLCVVNKSQDLSFADPYAIADSSDGKAHSEVGIAFANLSNKSIDTNNLMLHEVCHTLGSKHYPTCSQIIPYCAIHEPKGCEYYGYVMCQRNNLKGFHEMDFRMLSHLLKEQERSLTLPNFE